MIINILFWSFSTILLISALGVITIAHPVKSVLCLVICFFAAAALWLLLSAEFLALILLLVYVGAVMTLFLFVVMTMPNTPTPSIKFYLPVALMIAVLLAVLLIHALPSSVFTLSAIKPTIPNVHALGNVLYTTYVLPFEMVAIILFAAMIAAISLTLHDPIRRKQQSISAQIQVKPDQRIKLIS